ncbi:ATP-binding protein [Mesonia sp. MT50]|uniref:histidine kinase n=1 Tax=Mesonia profundi TaxID=3070998 RepID=A0ABU0ZXT8_9FLAO|nr:ATP-binding protein [Mesonia profundi]MDQ7916280.1 ATP-binding protein [Mesonia profundi]
MPRNTKRSITFKVVIGYLLLTAFTAISIWFIYSNVIGLNSANKLSNDNQQKLLLMNEAVTNVYAAEAISRDIIQNQKPENLPQFKQQLDTISSLIKNLQQVYKENEIINELDSLQNLLLLKEQNLHELLKVRKNNSSENYYDRVLNNLQKVNYLFEEDNYNELLKDYNPEARHAMVKWLEYAKKDNAQRLTQQSADSLINTVKNVLSELEVEERRYQQEVIKKENELLKNDQELSSQLRKIRSEMEREQIQKSVEQVNNSSAVIEETATIIAVLGIACILTIIFFVVLIIRDTNSSQRYKEELEKSKAYAEFLLKRRKQIMATVTHDLRSPLNTIMGYADLLKKTSLSDKQQYHLDHLKKSSFYILHLVNDLLDFSKLEAGKMTIEKLPFQPKSIIEDSIQTSIPTSIKNNLVIHTSLDKTTEETFMSDPFRIQQVLTNLLGNAYKFTEEGSIHIKASIASKTRKIKKLHIEISDTGIGISQEQQKNIFEEFSQADSRIEKQYGGSGLGLAITKKIVDLLKGSIRMESELDKGTTFYIEFPIETTSQTSIETEEISIKNTQGQRVLIIDDEPSQLMLTKEVISQAGFKVTTAKDGKEALEILKKQVFDLVITDIQMPKMNGFELIRKLRKIPKFKTLPVISLSGKTDVPDEIYLKKGFTTNFIKPFNANELYLEIANILDLEVSRSLVKEKLAKSSESYDVSELLRFTEGDRDSLKVILNSFIESSQQNLDALRKASAEANLQQIAFIAHRVLPMLRQLKAEKVVVFFEKLEHQQQHNLQAEEVMTMLEKAKKALENLLEEIKKEV